MQIPIFSMNEFMAFLLILIRISLILFMVPIFGSPIVPTQLKVGLALILALVLRNTINVDVSVFPSHFLGFVPLVLTEIFIGLTLSLIIRLVFEGAHLAGQFIGYQMGFGIVNVVDPQTGSQVSVLAQLSYILAIILFLVLNGHYIIIKALTESFELVPPGRLSMNPVLYDQVSGAVARMFIIAVKIGAPVMAVLLFAQVSMGIVAKTVPQMNILFVGFPVYIIVGLFLFGVSLNFFVPLLRRAITNLDPILLNLLRAM